MCFCPSSRRGRKTARPRVSRPVTNNRTGDLDRPLDPNSVYRNVVQKYGLEAGICTEATKLRVHSLRATAATNALSHEADIARVQEWLGHATGFAFSLGIDKRREIRVVASSEFCSY